MKTFESFLPFYAFPEKSSFGFIHSASKVEWNGNEDKPKFQMGGRDISCEEAEKALKPYAANF